MKTNSSGKVTAILVAVLVTLSIVTGGMAVMAQDHTGNDSSMETDDPQQMSYLRVVHASPDAPNVDVTLSPVEDETDETTTNETITNETDEETTDEIVTNETTTNETDAVENVTDSAETMLTNLSFGAASEYQHLSAGDYTVTVTVAGDDESVVFEGTVSLEPRTTQTLTISTDMIETGPVVNETDSLENETTEDTLDVDNETAVEDSQSVYVDNALEPMGDNATVRVIHLSPDAPAVDVMTENGTVLAEGVSFQNHSDYVTVPAGNYTVEIWESMPADDNETEMPGENETEDTMTEDDNVTDLEEETTDTHNASGEVLATAEVAPAGGNAYSVVATGLMTPAADDNETDLGEENVTEDNMTDMGEANETASGIFVVEDATTTISLPGMDDTMDGENETENETDTGIDLDENETTDDNETDAGIDAGENETEDDNVTSLTEMTDTESDVIVIENATFVVSSLNAEDVINDLTATGVVNETEAAT